MHRWRFSSGLVPSLYGKAAAVPRDSSSQFGQNRKHPTKEWHLPHEPPVSYESLALEGPNNSISAMETCLSAAVP